MNADEAFAELRQLNAQAQRVMLTGAALTGLLSNGRQLRFMPGVDQQSNEHFARAAVSIADEALKALGTCKST